MRRAASSRVILSLVGSDGSDAVTLYLQASRHGNDTDKRQYLMTLSAKDTAGNTQTLGR
jgi:hypothetical protein